MKTGCRIGLFGIVALTIAGCGHSESWKWGYDHAGDAAQFLQNGTSPESACRGTAGLYMRFPDSAALGTEHPPTDKDEAVAGCLAGLKKIGAA